MKAIIRIHGDLFQKVFISILIFSFLVFQSFGQAPKATPVKTGYAPVNGLKLYYEVYGQAGKPKFYCMVPLIPSTWHLGR